MDKTVAVFVPKFRVLLLSAYLSCLSMLKNTNITVGGSPFLDYPNQT